MNNVSRYILELYNYLLNVRDTLEFTINKEHKLEAYEARKKVLVDGIKEGFALGNFLINNEEKGQELKQKFETFIQDYYSPDSSIIKIAGDTVRVDYVQNIKLFSDVIPAVETLKDIIFQYMTMAAKNKELEPFIPNVVIADDRMFRLVFFMLNMREYCKSFGEFNKIMNESKGNPTPQSNFIVQNELSVMAKLFRDVRARTRFTDNETLDILDDAIKVVEMTEGRRDRVGNKSFKEIFDEINGRLSESVGKIEAVWKQLYGDAIKQLVPVPASEKQDNEA